MNTGEKDIADCQSPLFPPNTSYHCPLFFSPFFTHSFDLSFCRILSKDWDKVAAELADDLYLPCIAINPSLFRTTSFLTTNHHFKRLHNIWRYLERGGGETPNKEFERFVKN